MESEPNPYTPRRKKIALAVGIAAIGAAIHNASIEAFGFVSIFLATDYELARYFSRTRYRELESFIDSEKTAERPVEDIQVELPPSSLPELDDHSVSRMMQYINRVVYGLDNTEG